MRKILDTVDAYSASVVSGSGVGAGLVEGMNGMNGGGFDGMGSNLNYSNGYAHAYAGDENSPIREASTYVYTGAAPGQGQASGSGSGSQIAESSFSSSSLASSSFDLHQTSAAINVESDDDENPFVEQHEVSSSSASTPTPKRAPSRTVSEPIAFTPVSHVRSGAPCWSPHSCLCRTVLLFVVTQGR